MRISISVLLRECFFLVSVDARFAVGNFVSFYLLEFDDLRTLGFEAVIRVIAAACLAVEKYHLYRCFAYWRCSTEGEMRKKEGGREGEAWCRRWDRVHILCGTVLFSWV